MSVWYDEFEYAALNGPPPASNSSPSRLALNIVGVLAFFGSLLRLIRPRSLSVDPVADIKGAVVDSHSGGFVDRQKLYGLVVHQPDVFKI